MLSGQRLRWNRRSMILMRFDLLAQLKKSIPKHTMICFVSAVIVGWLTHFYMLSHKLLNWDDANSMGTYGSGDYLGRWFLKYIHPLGGRYSVPAVHGFLLILCIAVSACLILEIMRIRSTTGAVLTAVVLETFPCGQHDDIYVYGAYFGDWHSDGDAFSVSSAEIPLWMAAIHRTAYLCACNVPELR